MNTGSYSIGGVDFIDQPSTGKWLPRKSLGYDGNGRPIYPLVYDFEMDWDIISPSGFNQLENFYLASITGTVVANLPKYGISDYVFFPYSGCTLDEVSVDTYFAGEGYLMKTKLLVHKITV
jgi:hypothetical protein